MDLQRELRHKSEDIDDLVLLDVVKVLRRRVRKISHAYDVPYIAGYSEDGKTVFIDRHLPRSFRWLLKTVRVEPFLLTHEIVEKALLDQLRLHYLHAHQIAVRAERDAVRAAGISWGAYQSFMKKHEKPIEEERLIRVPRDLDLTPYRDEKDFGLLQRLVLRKSKRDFIVSMAKERPRAYQWFMKKHEKYRGGETDPRSRLAGPHTLPEREGLWTCGAVDTKAGSNEKADGNAINASPTKNR
jgi:hypothetical protein